MRGGWLAYTDLLVCRFFAVKRRFGAGLGDVGEFSFPVLYKTSILYNGQYSYFTIYFPFPHISRCPGEPLFGSFRGLFCFSAQARVIVSARDFALCQFFMCRDGAAWFRFSVFSAEDRFAHAPHNLRRAWHPVQLADFLRRQPALPPHNQQLLLITQQPQRFRRRAQAV